VIGNKRYADGTILIVREIVESANALRIPLDKVKLGDWTQIQSRGSPRPEDRGNRNIRLVSRDEAKVMLYKGSSWSRCNMGIRVPRIHGKLFEVIAELGVNCNLGCLARLAALDMSYNRAYCELQVSIPYELYLEYRRKYSRPLGNNIGGIDVNADRINLAIVGRNGILKDIKTFHYPSLASTTLKNEQRRSLIHRIIHDVLRYAYYHGVSTIFS